MTWCDGQWWLLSNGRHTPQRPLLNRSAHLLPNLQAARLIFHVGSGRQTSLNEMVRLLGEIVGREMTAVHGPPRQGDIRHSVADIKQAQGGLDFWA